MLGMKARNRPSADAHVKPAMPIFRGALLEKYIKVTWRHNFESEPVMLYSELDENRNELRKVEVYRNGHHDFSDGSRSTGNTRLSKEPIPLILDINQDGQFEASPIQQEEFDAVWKKRLAFMKSE